MGGWGALRMGTTTDRTRGRCCLHARLDKEGVEMRAVWVVVWCVVCGGLGLGA